MFKKISSLCGVLALVAAFAECALADDLRAEPDEFGKRVYVWVNEGAPGKFVPSGYMPDGEGITQMTNADDKAHSKPHHTRLYCQLSEKTWVGIYYLLEDTWAPSRSFDLFHELGAKKGDTIRCRFWARSANGVRVQFKVGGVSKGRIKDSLVFAKATKWIELKPDWTMHEIDLTGKDVSSVVGGFMWAVDLAHNGNKDVSFDLDTIYFVRVKK